MHSSSVEKSSATATYTGSVRENFSAENPFCLKQHDQNTLFQDICQDVFWGERENLLKAITLQLREDS